MGSVGVWSDYSVVAFPGENGNTQRKINCQRHAMVCPLDPLFDIHRQLLCSVVSAPLPWVLCLIVWLCGVVFGSDMLAFPNDIPLPW